MIGVAAIAYGAILIAFRRNFAKLDEWSINWMREGRLKNAVRSIQRANYWVSGIPLMAAGFGVAAICLL